MKAYKCSRGAGCELWEDDDMLLEEDQRQGRVDVQEPVAQNPVVQEAIVPPRPPAETAPPPYQEHHVNVEFDWILDNGMGRIRMFEHITEVLCRRHEFPTQLHPEYD